MSGQCCECPKSEHVPNTFDPREPPPVICIECMMTHRDDYEHDYRPFPRWRSKRPSERLIPR